MEVITHVPQYSQQRKTATSTAQHWHNHNTRSTSKPSSVLVWEEAEWQRNGTTTKAAISRIMETLHKKRRRNEATSSEACASEDIKEQGRLDVTTTATTVSSLKQDSDFDATDFDATGDEAQDCDSGDEAQDCDSGTTDTALYRIMEEKQSECFKNLDEVTAIIDAYEARTGNRLRIQKSLKDKFRVYHCCVHVDCRFQVRFSRRRSDGLFVVSRLKPKHGSVQRPSRAADGRQLKKRRQGRLDDVVVRVLRTKEGAPTPGDVVKTAGTKNNMSVPYQVAYRALNEDNLQQKKASVKNFQLIVPYLEEMKKLNPMSVIGYTRGDGFDIVDLHFFPSFANDVLNYVRPVISLDAAHLRSEYKGMLYIASVLSGNDDIYPIGFMIATGNEDRMSWTKMLGLLKQACPLISEQGFHRNVNVEDISVEPHQRSPFIFVSNRDKGLKPALKEVFPDHCETSCAKHIEANVTQRFGKQCGRHVMAMAKSYSLRYYNQVLDLIRTDKPRAAAYIEDITASGILWSNSQWTDSNRELPPRFGIVTSNTSESTNSMFNSARDLPWMDALEKMVEVMLTRICNCRTKYRQRQELEIVPRAEQLLKKRWEATASMSVMELEEESGVFTTTSCDYGGIEDENEGDEGGRSRHRNIGLPLQRQSSHIVKPAVKWCSCGVWQDTLLPCQHACAVYRKWKEADFNYILLNLIDGYYTYGFVQSTFKKNIYPVSLDTLAYDGKTTPPVSSKRSSGRPRKKRIRRRSQYAAAEDSPILCSNCGAPGHNRRTCSRPPAPARQIPELLPAVETNTELLLLPPPC